jgi:hypothetical protein
MKKVQFSNENLSIIEICEWHNMAQEALLDLRERVKQGRLSAWTIPVCDAEQPSKIFQQFISYNEIDYYFSRVLEELEKATVFNIMASVEASLRIDFLTRVSARKKDSLSREFRDLYKKRKYNVNKIKITEILDKWKVESSNLRGVIGKFNGALNYRDWLAHGRYWVPALGENYDLFNIHIISINVISILNI